MSAELKDLEKKVEALTNSLSKNHNSIDSFRFNGENQATSFFEDTPAKSGPSRYGTPFRRSSRPMLPKKYEAGQLGDYGSFLRTLMREGDKFKASHTKAFESLSLAKAGSINTTQFDEGGALVLPEYADAIEAMIYQEESLWGRTRSNTVGGNSMKFTILRNVDQADGVRHGGALGYWTGEGDPIQTSNLKFDELDVSLQKLGVAVFLTEEQIDDSGYDIVGFTNEVVQAEFDYQLDRALIRGDAVKKPMGLLKSSHRVTIDKESGQSAALVAENVINMLSRRCSSSPGDNWIILYNQDLEPFLTSMFLPTGPNSGELVYMPAGGLAGNKYATLGGYPCMASEHCSTAGKEGDIIFWNAKDYVSINKGGINTYASPHVKFLEDMNCLKFTFRVNGRPMYDEPIKMEQSAKLRSSIITVEDRI